MPIHPYYGNAGRVAGVSFIMPAVLSFPRSTEKRENSKSKDRKARRIRTNGVHRRKVARRLFSGSPNLKNGILVPAYFASRSSRREKLGRRSERTVPLRVCRKGFGATGNGTERERGKGKESRGDREGVQKGGHVINEYSQ